MAIVPALLPIINFFIVFLFIFVHMILICAGCWLEVTEIYYYGFLRYVTERKAK